MREHAKGNDDDGIVLVSRVRTRRGIKRKRAASLDFRVSSGKRKTMVYDDGVCGKHLVSQDFPDCNLRTDGFESAVSIGETKIRKFGPSSVFEEEEVGGCEQVQRLCLNFLVSDEKEEVSVLGKKKKKRKRRRKKKRKKMEENEFVVPEGTHDRQEVEVGRCEQVQRLCLKSLVSDEEEEVSVLRKKKRKSKRRRKKKRNKMEENKYVVPGGTHDRQVSREEGVVEGEDDDELIIKEKQNDPSMNQRKRYASEFSHSEDSVKRKRRRTKKRKKMEENKYVVPAGTHDRPVSREEGVVEGEDDDDLIIKEKQNDPSMNQRKRYASEFSHSEDSVKRKRKRRRTNKRKKMEENKYVVPGGTHDRPVSREEGMVEGEDDDELIIKEKQKDPSMNQRKSYASEFSHFEDSVKRKRGKGGEERLRAGDIIWANSSEEEWWPGWVFKVNKLKVLVSIFGQARFCWLSVFQVLPFEENYVEKSKNAGGKLKVAIDNALEELGKRAALGLICFCEGLMKFNEDEKSAVVNVPGYSKSSNYTLEQIIKARAEFRPLEMLSFLQKAALFVFINDSDSIGANRAIAQANAYRRFVSITPDWIYWETMRLTEVGHADESDKGNCEAGPLASSLGDNKVCYGACRSSNSLTVGVAAEEMEKQMEVEETEDGGGEEETKNNLMIVERKEEKKDKVHERPLYREEFQRSDLQKSNVLLSLEESYDKPRNKTLLQEEIEGIEESEEDILDLGFCVTNEMDFSSLCSDDEYGSQVSETPEHTGMIETVSSQANEFRINPQEHTSIETSFPSLFETLTHLRCLAVDPFYDSDGVAFVFKAVLKYRDVTFLTIASLKSLEVTLDRHCECSNSADPKISVSPSYVADSGNYATGLRDLKNDSFEISSALGGKESPKRSPFSSVPNNDMLSRYCQRTTTVASQECSSVYTKIPSLLDTLTHLRCLAQDPFSGAVCAASVSKAFLRYRAVTFLNIANLNFSEGSLNRHFKPGDTATRETSTVLPSAKKDVLEVGAIPRERDEVKGVPGSAVLDDAMLSRSSGQETHIAFNAVNKLISNVQDNLSVEASKPSLCETLTNLRCLALDPLCDPQNLAFVCKAFLRYRAVSSSFSNVLNNDMLSRSCQHVTTLASQGCGSVDTKMPSLLDALAHLRCLALDPFSGAVGATFVSKAFLRYRAVTFLNITNLKFSEGTLNRRIKSGKNASRETRTALPSVMEQGNDTTSDCHAKKDIFEVGAIPHERDKGLLFSAVPDDAMLSRISEQEINIEFSVVNKPILNVHDNLSVEVNVPCLCEILTHLHFLALDPFYDPHNVAFVCKTFLRYRAVSSLFSNVNSDMLGRSHQHITTLVSQECGSVDTKMPSLLDTLTHLRCLALDPLSGEVSAAFVSKAFLRYRAVTFLNITNLKFSEGTLNHHFKSGENATTETSTVPPSVTEQGNGATSDCHTKKDAIEVGAIPHERDKVKVIPCSAVPDDATLSRISEQERNTGFDAVNKLLLNVQNNPCVETNVPSLCGTLTHLRCLALDPFYDPETVAFVCKTLLRYRALSFKLKSLKDTYNHHCILSNSAAQEIVMVTSTSISGSEDRSSVVHRDNKNFGIGRVLKRAEVRNISTSAVRSEKDQHSCESQKTQNPVSLVKNMEGPFSSKSLTTSNKQQISTSNVVNLEKTSPGWNIHLGMQGSEGFLVALDDDNPKDATNEDLAGEINCKTLALSVQTSGFSVAETCEKRGTSLVSPGISAPSATSGVGLPSAACQLLDEVIQDESFTVNHGDANSRGGLAGVTSAKQHDFDDASGPIAQRQCLGSSLATSLDEIFMFLCCLARDLSYGGDHSNLVKQAFLRYRVASYHKNSAEHTLGLSDSLEHSGFGSLLTKSWPNYIAATAMPGDSQSAATDRIPDVSITIDNRGAHSDGGYLIRRATVQHDLNDTTEICNSISIAQRQVCSSSVTTQLGELYLFLRCLACDPFFDGEYSTSAKRAFLRYRVASYEKLCSSSAVEYRHGMSDNHERMASQSLSETWPNSHAITDRVPDDSHKERNVSPEINTNSDNQCFSSTITSANHQTNGSGCSQNVNMISETTSHTDLSKCYGNSFPQKRKSDGSPAANPLHKLKKPCGAVLLGNWYASPLVRDGLSRSVDDVQVPARSPTENTKSERFSISPENHDEVGSYLHMKFPKNFELPSQDQLMNTFRRFGPIDYLKTRVFFYTGSGQVCFQRHADAEAAFKFAREKALFGQANIKFWVSRPEKSTHRVQGYNCTDSVGKPKSGESGNDVQSLCIDKQQLKGCDYTNRAQSLPISNVKSCLRKLSQPGEKDQPKSSKATFSVDSQSGLPAVSIMSPLTLLCNHSLRKESGVYQQKMLSLLKDCEQLIGNIRGSVGLESYYELLIHELRSSFREPDE